MFLKNDKVKRFFTGVQNDRCVWGLRSDLGVRFLTGLTSVCYFFTIQVNMLAYDKYNDLVCAVNRLAFNSGSLLLRQKLESCSFRLLENLALERFDLALKNVVVLTSFLEFGRCTFQIESLGADIVIKELNKLNSAIRQLSILPDFSEESRGIFSGSVADVYEGDLPPESNSLTATLRQGAVLEKVRQIADCQLKDLMADFPDVSERTLRYDLQKLAGQGLINRTGAGPSTCYVIK